MKTRQEIEEGAYTNGFKIGYDVAREDIIKLIDKLKEAGYVHVQALKTRIEG